MAAGQETSRGQILTKRRTPFAPYPMAFRAGSVGPSAPGQQRVRYVRGVRARPGAAAEPSAPAARVAPAQKTYASQWSRHCRPRPQTAATTSPTAAAAFCAISRTTWDMTTRTPHFRIDAAGALCFCHGPLAPPGRASAMSARGPHRTALAPPRAGFPKKRPPAPLVGGQNRRPWRADASCR